MILGLEDILKAADGVLPAYVQVQPAGEGYPAMVATMIGQTREGSLEGDALMSALHQLDFRDRSLGSIVDMQDAVLARLKAFRAVKVLNKSILYDDELSIHRLLVDVEIYK